VGRRSEAPGPSSTVSQLAVARADGGAGYNSRVRQLAHNGFARGTALMLVGTVGLLAVTHLLGRIYWHDVVFALNGWYVPYDLAVFLRAGDDVLAGRSPYPDPATFAGDANYVYPPPLALVMTAFSALPEGQAATLFTLLGIAAVILGIWLLGVRDRRCYVVAFAFPYTIESLKYGALGTFLVLVVAALWRFRDSAAGAGLAAAGALVLKLFLWPLLPWLAFTRRWRAFAVSVGAAVVLTLSAWALIEFRGLTDYPTLLRKLSDLEASSSYSTIGVLRALGLSSGGAQAVALVFGLALLGLAWRAATRLNDDALERDRRSLIFVLVAALVLTPIVWQHYLALLVVPIALARPRLSPLWALPLAAWPFYVMDWYDDWPDGDLAPLLSTVVFVGLVFVFALRPRMSPARSAELEPA
jgi:Glycosyltransferase family 87